MIYPAHAAGARRADLGASAARAEADGRTFRLALAHNGQRQRQRMADPAAQACLDSATRIWPSFWSAFSSVCSC